MSKRLAVLLAPFCCLALLFSPLTLAKADTASSGIGKQVAGFTLKDTQGHNISLKDFKDKKAVVVVFIGTECPISNAFLPSLAQLHKEYGPKGVQFLAINSNRHDTPEQVAAHAEKYGIPFAVLKDADNRVADEFGARRTPEAFLLDADGKLRYQGRVDDQYGVGYKRAKPTRRDLAIALNEVLAGKPVSQSTTPVAGCVIARAVKPKTDGAVTYTKQVARIMQQRCQECHRPGQVGPMSLRTYDSTVAWSETIREVVSDRRMPPWHADPRYGKFSNDRSLSAQERDTLLAWIDEGCPKGDDKDLPPPREFTSGWQIGQPDLILTMEKEFDVPAVMPRGGVPYKYFTVPTNFKEDRWIVRAEAKPGASSVVHHIVVFIVPPGKKFNPDDPESQVLCGTAPGDMPVILPPGMAKRIPAGSRLIYQMHYTPNGKPQKDRSSVGLIFAPKPPDGEIYTVPVFNASFLIKPGDSNYEVESEFTFSGDAKVVSFMPHMHLRGKDFLIEAIYPDKKKETLLSVPRFDFNWQSAYRFTEPRVMPKGTTIHCVAHFDNSAKNLNNPDPTAVVYWGDQTWEEMMIGWMDFAYVRKAK
jgi:peroxiredoxin